MAAEETVQQVIDNAIDQAQTYADRANDFAEEAVRAAKYASVPTPTWPEIDEPTEPALTAPPLDLGNLFEGEQDAKQDEIEAFINEQFQDWLNTYYPDFTAKLASVAGWLDNAITNGGTGLSPAVESQIWDRARTREDALNQRSTDDAVSAMAARGWALPSGVLAERLRVNTQENINRDSGLSRDIAIKQAELEQSNVRFAVQQSVALHLGIIQAAANWVSLMLRSYTTSADLSNALLNATIQFYNQSIQYYQARIQFENLLLNYSNNDFEANRAETLYNLDAADRQAKNHTNAAISAAQQMGGIAQSAIASQNTMATIVSETTSEV